MSPVSIRAALKSLGGVAGKVFAESVSIEELMARQMDLSNKTMTLQEQIDAEKRQPTAEEAALMKDYCDEFDAIQADIDRRERMNAQAAHLQGSMGRTVPAEPVDATEDVNAASAIANSVQPKKAAYKPQASGNYTRIEESGPSMYGMHGFHNIGDFALAVQKASVRGGRTDPRLVFDAPTASSAEGTNADGGYAVPPDFRNEILKKVMGEASLLQYCDQQTSASNALTFPKDETTPWQATGGVRVNWTAEGGKITESKVALGEETVKLEKLAALLPVTEELLQDAPAISRYISSRVPEVLGFAINNAILNGTGTGQPLGVLAAGNNALKTVAKETGQTADTVVFQNIVNMWAGMYAAGKSRCVWVMHPTVSTQLMSMAFPGTGTAVPVYMPPSGLSGSPYATLLGRPVIESEACAPLGDAGDINLLDLSKYMIVQKAVGMRADVSMHLYFDYDIVAYRFVLRVGGKPWWSAPITSSDGTTTYSAFVSLAERA